LQLLQEELGDRITGIQGTGLLLSAEVDGKRFKAFGSGSLEEHMRMHGISVVHGGKNSLRYTPHFNISSEEIGLIIDATRNALLNTSAKASASEAAAA
jgi:acetylornithine/succinyldiaminopimelate/putrescine aminotransferase